MHIGNYYIYSQKHFSFFVNENVVSVSIVLNCNYTAEKRISLVYVLNKSYGASNKVDILIHEALTV